MTATRTVGILWFPTNISTEEEKKSSFHRAGFANITSYLQERQAVREAGEGKQGTVQGPCGGVTCAAASVKPQRALEAVAMASPNSGRFPFLAFWEMPVMASPST